MTDNVSSGTLNTTILYYYTILVYKFKVVLQLTFFISTNEQLMYKFYKKNVIILFLNKAVIIKKNFVIS